MVGHGVKLLAGLPKGLTARVAAALDTEENTSFRGDLPDVSLARRVEILPCVVKIDRFHCGSSCANFPGISLTIVYNNY
jgi:hypothetical protein